MYQFAVILYYFVLNGYLNLTDQVCTHQHMQHLDKMKSLEDVYGQALALENIAKTYEYMANLTKACETLEQVGSPCIGICITSHSIFTGVERLLVFVCSH